MGRVRNSFPRLGLIARMGWLLGLGPVFVSGTDYDPLAFPVEAEPVVLDLTVKDRSRKREIPIRVYLAPGPNPAPVILFSHGLGGSREGNAYLGQHWARRGFVGVFLQHPGSDSTVWQDVPPARRIAAMREAASGRNFMLRVGDVSAVLDQLVEWNETGVPALGGRLEMTKVGMSGHSFGAVTTQAVSGQRTRIGAKPFTDARITAALLLSPSSPREGTPRQAFSRVAMPWLLMTGTHDTALIGSADVASRLAVFPALPPGGKYELVLYRGEHSAFTDRALPGDTERRNPNHHRVILAISTAFWEAHLRQDSAARAWLDSDGPGAVLETGDRWQSK